MPGAELFISVLVIGEIRRGVEQIRTRDPHQAEVYERWLAQIDREYGDHVLRITSEVADEWGRLNAAGSLPVIDALMAATARVHHLTFVTRDVGDVARTGVPILNPFVD